MSKKIKRSNVIDGLFKGGNDSFPRTIIVLQLKKEKKKTGFDSDIFAPLRLKKILFHVPFSDLVIFSFDNHSWLIYFLQGE